MPSKKKNKTKRTKSKIAKSKIPKSKIAKPKRAKTALRKKASRSQRKPVRKNSSAKKAASQASPAGKRKAPQRAARQSDSSWARKGAVSNVQAGDLEGLSRAERADSESVDELVEEGNIFEAGAVAGVEEADDQDTREVHTREVSEDDVPDEYLDKE